MEEPLLGSKGRVGSSFSPSLCQIPEETEAVDPQTIRLAPPSPSGFREGLRDLQILPNLASSPSDIKQILVFGSPNASPRSQSYWAEYPVPHQQSRFEDQESHLLDYGEEVCTCRNLSKEVSGSFRQTESRAFDDSFLDNTTIESFRSRERSLATLRRLDLDVRRLTPRNQTSPHWPVGIGRAFNGGDPAKDLEEFSSCKSPVLLKVPSRKLSTECKKCTKKQFHRSRTAPAITVMEDKAAPHTKHENSQLQHSMTPGSVVLQAFIGLLMYLSVGVAIYIWKQDEFEGATTYDFVDAIYFCIVTLCTIGYGDITPATPFAKIFSCVFVLVGFGFIDILLSSMVNYVLDRQEAYLLDSVTGGHHERTKKYLVDVKKGRMRIRMKVALAFGVVIACIGFGTSVMHFMETLGWLDSFYLACMSVTTVGYGDVAFRTVAGRLFASLWLLVSTLAVARSFLYLAEARIDRRHRFIAKLILKEKMTFGDLVAADLDNDGSISKSDFVVYKLKLMGKIEEKDVAEVCRQFDTVDTESSGKITLSCLINMHESSVDFK